MFCYKCGQELPDNAEFCLKCGSKTIAPSQNQSRNTIANTTFIENSPKADVLENTQIPTSSIGDTSERLHCVLTEKTLSLLNKYGVKSKIGANYKPSTAMVGGTLYLFDKGMKFQSHHFNFENGSISFLYSDISQVAESGKLNCVTILTKDGKEHEMVLSNKKNAMKFLTYMSENATQSPFSAPKYVYETNKQGEAPSNFWVWTCCLVPLLNAVVGFYVMQDTSITEIEQKSLMMKIMMITYGLNCGLCYFDSLQSRKREVTVENESFWSFLVPVYLFKRAKSLNQNNSYAIIWCIVFVLSLFFSI